jgi:hypothetical protein
MCFDDKECKYAKVYPEWKLCYLYGLKEGYDSHEFLQAPQFKKDLVVYICRGFLSDFSHFIGLTLKECQDQCF